MLETRRNGRMLAPWTYTSEELCELEIDHKFPQIRWRSDEEENKVTMSEEEIKLAGEE